MSREDTQFPQLAASGGMTLRIIQPEIGRAGLQANTVHERTPRVCTTVDDRGHLGLVACRWACRISGRPPRHS